MATMSAPRHHLLRISERANLRSAIQGRQANLRPQLCLHVQSQRTEATDDLDHSPCRLEFPSDRRLTDTRAGMSETEPALLFPQKPMQGAATCIEHGIGDNPARAAQLRGVPVENRPRQGAPHDQHQTYAGRCHCAERGDGHRIKHDHRRVKRRNQTTLGFKSTASAATILSGIEMAHRMCKRQGRAAYSPCLQAPTSSKSSRPEYHAY